MKLAREREKVSSCGVSCHIRTLAVLLAVVCAAGCSRPKPAEPQVTATPALRRVVFQSDWFPQAEHGGYYQALAKGFYREAGLSVEIRPGGNAVGIKLPVAKGEADFGMNRSDDLMVAASRGMPLVIVGATFQHDPQALMVHADSPVKTFRDLEGRTLTASLSMNWIPFLQKKYGLKFNLKPNTYGLASFLADPTAIQQCLVTNEPFFAQQRGANVRTLPLTDSGYDVYHAVFCRRELVRLEPNVVRAFLAASIRGWRDYLTGDPTPAHALILKRNPQMTPAQLAFSRSEMIQRDLVTGDAAHGEDVGQISLTRLSEQLDVLLGLKLIDASVAVHDVATREFLPPPVQ
jgi:NitT/TauT family transport system substrate-binding protein